MLSKNPEPPHAAIANEGCGAENPFACRSARSPRRLNCVDHVHFNKLSYDRANRECPQGEANLFFAASIARSRLRAERTLIAR
jgi:hypothetical protein